MKNKLICFLVGEAPHDKKGEALQAPTIKSVPHYFQTTVPQQFLISQEKLVVESRKILKKDKGDLTFLTPDERLKKRAFDIDGDYFLSQVDILHTLFCTAESGGSNGVNALVKRMNWNDSSEINQMLEVAYQVLPQPCSQRK